MALTHWPHPILTFDGLIRLESEELPLSIVVRCWQLISMETQGMKPKYRPKIRRPIGANKHCAGQSRDFTPIEVHGTFKYYYPVPVRGERRKNVNNGLTVDTSTMHRLADAARTAKAVEKWQIWAF